MRVEIALGELYLRCQRFCEGNVRTGSLACSRRRRENTSGFLYCAQLDFLYEVHVFTVNPFTAGCPTAIKFRKFDIWDMAVLDH